MDNETIRLQSSIMLNSVKLFIKQIWQTNSQNTQEYLDFLDELNKLSVEW